MSKIQKIIVSVILCALVFLAGAGAYIYYTDAKEKAAYERAERLEKERKVKRLVTLEENFEAFLNGFVDEVAKDVRQYKQSRALIKGLIDLDGLSSPREIEQNFKLGEETMMLLNTQKDEILSVFEGADETFKTQFQSFPAQRQVEINQSWVKVREKQGKLYEAYFVSDQDVLIALYDLLIFYRNNPEGFVIDEENEILVYSDYEKNLTYRTLLARYEAMKSLQEEMFSNGG